MEQQVAYLTLSSPTNHAKSACKSKRVNPDQLMDNAIKEGVRGVGLNQKLDESMMGGAINQSSRQEPSSIPGQASAAGGLAQAAALSSSQDGAATALVAESAGPTNSFKLPNITRGSHSSQPPFRDIKDAGKTGNLAGNITVGSNPMNQMAGANAPTNHHFNVTVGEDKFYYTNNEKNQNLQRLPEINKPTGSSIRLKTQLGNEYIGLMSKKNKERLGSLDNFNVQNSFNVGGPAFNIQESKAETLEPGVPPQDPSKALRMLTIDPVITTKIHKGLQDSDPNQSKGSRGSRRNLLELRTGPPGMPMNQKHIQTLQSNAKDGDLRQGDEVPDMTVQLRQQEPTVFQNYLGKVISSVNNRKKNPRLKSLFIQESKHHSLDQYTSGLDALGDYGSPNMNKNAINESHLITQSILNQNYKQTHLAKNITGSLNGQDYDGHSLSGRGSQKSRGTRGNQFRESILTGGPGGSQFDNKTQSSVIPKSQTTQVSLLGNKNVDQKEPKATEQVAYLLRQIQKKGQIFLPLERVNDPNSHLMFKENKNPPENNAGVVVFSKNGFVSVAKDKNQITDFISNDQYIEDGVTHQILKDIPFFKKFQSMRFFKQWKTTMRLNSYERTRQKLAQNCIFSKPIFSEKFGKLFSTMNGISELTLIEIQPNVTYGKKQQSTLEDKSKAVLDQNRGYLEKRLTEVNRHMLDLKKEIMADDERFQDEVKQRRVQEMVKGGANKALVMFHSQRVKTEAIEEQYRLKRLRHTQYDQLLFMVFRYWSAKIIDLLYDSKRNFKDIFINSKNCTQFEVSICFGSDGKLDSDPKMDDHLESFAKVFEDMEQSVFKNQFLQFLMHDMNDLFFVQSSQFTRSIFDNMQKIIQMNTEYKENHKYIFDRLNKDVQSCLTMIDSYKDLQQIQVFCSNWNQEQNDRSRSFEVGMYTATYQKMAEFTEMIKIVPSGSTKIGTIVVETNTLKKQVTDMPKKVKDSIKHNLTQQMESETKTLKEELGKTTEILDQLPTSLNTYVEQKNTLKYIDLKQDEFKKKHDNIEDLHKQCTEDKIKVSVALQMAIEEVNTLYRKLPSLQETSAEQLKQNQETMEKIMKHSSMVLSKKIKAFEMKYVDTYLHDKTRLDDCGDTLEELFKRSKAIHEIRSKVILYREFLKLLYENEENPKEKMEQNKLSCAEDFENLQEIHKHTIRLWKILLYWKKRRTMCYNTPFLNLDTQMIIKSIHKVMKYLDDKLPQHEFVQRQSRSICKIIYQQVKETNIIIDFVKDLRRDSLQNRHWMQIFDLIKAPHLKTQTKFTIVDLREYNIQNYREDIHQIIEHANTEQKYETIFKSICDEWEKLELKIIPFKDTQNSYIMVNTETLNQAIEENMNTLEVISQSEFATHISKDILAWIQKLKKMHHNLDIWIDAQRYWVNLDIIYNSAIFSNIFGETTKQFINTRLQFQRIMWSSYKNPKAIYNLMIESRIKVFKEMTVHFQVLQKKVHEFLEEKRLIFSRFFFLNDSQFLELLTLANTSQDFSMYVNTLFVGAQNLYIQPADQVRLQKHEGTGSLDAGGGGVGDEISEEDSILSDDENFNDKKSALTGQQSVENSKMGIEGVNEYQVLGMISQNKELFLFESPVQIQNDNKAIKEVEGYEVSGTGTGNVEQWLIGVEKSMQATMRKQMQYAVKSFATRALDEWVLDYPQQVIVTTLNLVLTNEINDILEEKQRLKEAEDAEGSDNENENQEDMEIGDDAGEDDQEKEDAGGEGKPKSPGGTDTQRDSVNKDSQEGEQPVVNKRTLKGAPQLKLTLEDYRKRLLADLFGNDFRPDERFQKAVESANEDIRARRVMQSQTATAGTAAAQKAAAKRNQKRPDYKDWVMELLGQQSFYGIFLRIQFWVNKIIRSLNDERKSDWQDKNVDFSLTGVQKMVMRNVILYLIHQREIVDKMIILDIHDKHDFEWASKVKVLWNEAEDAADPSATVGPIVQCGGWQQQLGTEYLGSQQRLPLSPLTDRYYVFISSALREKSGVLFRCNQSHQHASDVFQEFANQCHMPHSSFQCNQDMNVSQLMQVINGAAMAKFWVFFEHLDNLPLVNFQIIIKEIQMVQQQYIIAELSAFDSLTEGNPMTRGIHISENKSGAVGSLEPQRIEETLRVKSTLQKPGANNPANKLAKKILAISRPSLGIFGSLSSHIIIRNPDIAGNLNLQAQSTFRTVSLAKPDMHVVIKMLLKSEGYHFHEKLSRIANEFIAEFINKKNEILYGKDAGNSEYIDKITEKLVLKDLKIAVRFAILLKDQEWNGYLDKKFGVQQRKWKFELQLFEKTLVEKQQELEMMEAQKEQILKDKEQIEVDALREGFRNILKTKFFNEWRAVQQQKLTKETGSDKARIDEGKAERELEGTIASVYDDVHERIKREEEEEAEKAAEEQKKKKQAAEDAPVPEDPIGSTLRRSLTAKRGGAKRRLTHASTSELNFASRRQKDEFHFMNQVEEALKRVAASMSININDEQLYHCIGVVEYMRRQKAVAIVGPVCSGKTQILKMVSCALKKAYGILFRTSLINPQTFTKEEFYGPINAFESQNQQDQDEALKKKSIFQIILDNYQHEKLGFKPEDRNKFIQSFLIDSQEIDSYFLDSLIQFIQQSNIREREYYDDQEFLLHLSTLGQAHDTLIQHLPITLPNGNVIMLPSDLYFFFETEDLSNASPLFLSQVGLVITQDSNVAWHDLYQRCLKIYFSKHSKLGEEAPHRLDIEKYFTMCQNDFIFDMIAKLDQNEKVKEWHLWNKKSLVLQFFKILNSMTHRLHEACDKNLNNEDPMQFPIQEMKQDTIYSMILCSFVMTFGVCLNNALQEEFTNVFGQYKRKFNMHINSQAVQRPTMFDIYFDVERLSWEVIQEKLEYKLKLGFYPKMSALLVPTPTIALSYFIMEQLTYYLKRDEDGPLDKNFRVLGPQGTSKSVILNTFIHRSQEQFDSIMIPMSSYLSFDRLRKVIEKQYVAKRKKIFAPKNENKKIVIMIDDLHLQSNLKINIVEFMRTWTRNRGYFDVGAGIFKRIADFSVIMAQNSSYRVTKCKQEGRNPLRNRFLFYTNTQYSDEMDSLDKYKPFVQHWLTSKMWAPNKLLQKYYIIITNGLMALLQVVKRSDQMNSSSFTPLISFDILAKFCSSLVMNTIISDDPGEIGLKGQREEEAVANVVLYEVFRNYADRIYKPQDRIKFAEKAVEEFRREFQMKDAKVEYIDKMIIGNFHERQTSSYIKFINNTHNDERVKDMIIQKIAEKSNNHFLASILDTPNGIRDVFRLSRILFKEQQHLILCGSPSSSKYECLQIATILNDVVMMELNTPKFNEPTKFANAFKQALLTVCRLDETNCFIVINDEQLRDPVYIDFVHNYIANIGKDEECILMDEEFKAKITSAEEDLFMKNKDNFKYDKTKKPNLDTCLQNGVKKLMKHVHVVFMINDMQTYHEWFSLFPGLETKCDVMFVDDLHTEGYRSLTGTFLERSKIDEDMDDEDKTHLIKSMVEAKEIAKKKIFDNFYTQEALRNISYEKYLNGQGVETVYPNEQKAHFYMFDDGNFKVYDPLLKQVNYNLRAELHLVMKARYLMYLEVFRFLYDFLSLNLSIRKNYYETFIKKTVQFDSFFGEINSKKKDLHGASNNINYKLTMIQDKINRINASIKDRELTIRKRKAENEDLELQLKNQQDEVDQVLEDKIADQNQVLDDFQRLNERDITHVVSIQDFSKAEQALLNTLVMIIEKNENTKEYDKELHETYFLETQELYAVLNDRRSFEYNDACFKRLRDFITKYQPSDFTKPPIIKVLYDYLKELYRRLNVRNTMSVQYNQIKEIEANIKQNNYSSDISDHLIKKNQADLQLLNEKIQRVKQRDNKLSKKIEVAEISHMRTQHIFDSVKEYGQKIKLKLDRINSRLQALLGDCIILASSICFLGFFSSDERIEIRNEIVEFVQNAQGITCSKDWVIDGKSPNPKIQNKMFKSILKEYGLRQILLPHNYSGILTESTICETLFHMIFAPSCPLIIDPTGEVQELIRSKIISKLHVKQLYGSDLNVNPLIQNVLRSQSSFGLLNDVNNFEKASFGLTQDQSLLHRLTETFYNGIDFNYERSVLWKKVSGIEEHIFNSFNCLNKKMPVNEPNMENVSLYQIQMFSPSFDYQNGGLFMAKGSCFTAMSTNEDIFHNKNGVNAWMEIKELMLEQINNHEWKQLQEVKEQIKFYDENKSQLNKAYENNFLVANHDTLQRINEYTNLKQSIEDIDNQSEERIVYKRMYEEMISKYDILTYYSKVILNMFLSLKLLSKIMNEVTYSWKMFKQILQQILKQVIKSLAQEAISSKDKKGALVTKGKTASKPQVEIDLKFFQKNLIPKLHKTLVTSVRQDSSAPLFNLIFAMRIALLQDKISSKENIFFLKQLLVLKDFHDWRKTELDFVNMDEDIPRIRLIQIKRDVSRLYPEFGKKFVEKIEADLGQTFKYKDASLYIFKLFKDPKFKNITLVQEICLGFLCPDHEFKSKLTQFVYEQLSEVFDFSEEYSRLHQFLTRAAWKNPIALLSVSHVNMINTISSIAQHYGVGLDVIRTDHEADKIVAEQKRGINIRSDNIMKANLLDQTAACMETKEQKYQRLQTMATSYLNKGNICSDLNAPLTKLNFSQNSLRSKFENPDKKISESKDEDPVKLIERCAKQGSWVLVSTIRFPQFWKRACSKLEQLRDESQIDEQFRLIFDLQGYAQNDISDSFLFDYAVSFHMTEQNTEAFEGFDDIWSAILDERILIKLGEKIDALKVKIIEDQKPQKKYGDESKSEDSESEDDRKKLDPDAPESPSNFKLIDNTIKSPVQKSLYKQFMNESKVENQGLKFDLMRAQEPSEQSEEEQQDQGDEKEETVVPQTEDPSGSALKEPEDAEAELKAGDPSKQGPESESIPELANEEGKPQGASASPDETRDEKPDEPPKEGEDLKKDPSKSTVTESTLPNKVAAHIDKNNEEFKQLNEAQGKHEDSSNRYPTSRSPEMSVDGQGQLPLGPLTPGHTQSHAQLGEPADSPLQQQAPIDSKSKEEAGASSAGPNESSVQKPEGEAPDDGQAPRNVESADQEEKAESKNLVQDGGGQPVAEHQEEGTTETAQEQPMHEGLGEQAAADQQEADEKNEEKDEQEEAKNEQDNDQANQPDEAE